MPKAITRNTTTAPPLTSGKTALAKREINDQLTKLATCVRASHPDAELIARCSRIVELQEQIEAFYSKGATPIEDDDERDAVIEPISAQLGAAIEGILTYVQPVPQAWPRGQKPL